MNAIDPRRVSTGAVAAWLAAGIGIVTAAFAVHPIHTSLLIFLLVLGAGVAALAVGGASWVGDRSLSRKRKRARRAEHRRLLALDCHTLHEALTMFAHESADGRPRAWLLGGGRYEDWSSTTRAHYRQRFREWALRVFDEAVELGTILPNSRSLVDAPDATQLTAVRDLFLEIGQRLEQPEGRRQAVPA